MQREHCSAVDSLWTFVSPSYQLHARRRRSTGSCTLPSAGLAKLGIDEYPLVGEERSSRGTNHPTARMPVPPAAFATEVQACNARLADVGESRLLEGEFIAARLYTGPMYVKYNSVLRSATKEVAFLVEQCEGSAGATGTRRRST